MRVKTYRGRNTREVMAKIKAELGSDAVILDTQSRRENGSMVCEVMAAVEPPDGPPRTAAPAASAPEWHQWRSEWLQLKDNLMGLLKPHLDPKRLTPKQHLFVDYLEREGVGHEVLLDLWHRLKDRPKASPLGTLSSMISNRPWDPSVWTDRFHALAGPHGVGKTTTTLRLALKTAREDPSLRICLVNADLHHGKGRLYLRHYAELSGIEYQEAGSPKDWALISRRSQKYDKVFIDLPGLPPGITFDDWANRQGMDLLRNLQVHLTLSPLYSDRQLEAFLRAYKSRTVASLVWTKLDEACTFGAMINTAHATGLPASVLSCGPSLKNSLAPAQDKAFWTLILKHEMPECTGGKCTLATVDETAVPQEPQPLRACMS